MARAQPVAGEQLDLIYARLSHPNAEILEDQIVPLEPDATAAAVFNSGMAAITTLFFTLAGPQMEPLGMRGVPVPAAKADYGQSLQVFHRGVIPDQLGAESAETGRQSTDSRDAGGRRESSSGFFALPAPPRSVANTGYEQEGGAEQLGWSLLRMGLFALVQRSVIPLLKNAGPVE